MSAPPIEADDRGRVRLSLARRTVAKLGAACARLNVSPSRLVNTLIDKALDDEQDTDYKSTVEFLLRPGSPTLKPSWENGGRWLLEWFLLREPSWAQKHVVVFPRCWPLQVSRRETRCEAGGTDTFSVNDHLQDLCSGNDPWAHFPRLEPLTEAQWLQVCRRFEGCCGERLREPQGNHWESRCFSSGGSASGTPGTTI